MAFKHKRVRVEKGLYKSGDSFWACATASHTRTASWKKIGPVGIQEARRIRDTFAFELKNGNVDRPTSRITVRQLADEWFDRLDELEAAGELRPRTVSSYKTGVKLHVLPHWASREAGSISSDELVAWHEVQRRSGAAAWSIRARWMSIRGLLGYAVRNDYIVANPCEALTRRERPKPGRARARYLTEPEIEALLRHSPPEAALVNATLVFSGLRVSELLGLTWADIDFMNSAIRVRYQMSRDGKRVPLKTQTSARDVILMTQLALMLKARKLAAPFSGEADLVIANGVGRTLGYTRLRKAFAHAAREASVKGATPHTCRHTFASILIDGGASVEFVSQQLGHASTKTTWDIYVHLFRIREQADAARQGLDAAFGHMLRAAGHGPTDDD
jgi:integrase